jgi:uncharacterized membrane protein YfcA
VGETLLAAIQTEGLWFLVCGALIAGVVRGFSGFGTAMIYLPFAAQVVPPLWAILTLIAMDLIGPIPLIKPAFKDAQRRDLMLLLGGSLCLLPVGLVLLSTISTDTYRYLVSSISIVLLVCLVFGLRYSGKMYPALVAAVGGLAGFSGGLGGVPGPPVILFYMASTLPVRVVRANMMLFLFFTDILIISVVGIRGELYITPLIIGLMMAVPNGIGNLIGAAIFNPDKAGIYKAVAYIVIAASAVMGLPIWNG